MKSKKGLTRISKGAGHKILIRDSSNNATFSLHLPYSVGGSFSIGSIQFENVGSCYRPMQAIPASWYVNLNV